MKRLAICTAAPASPSFRPAFDCRGTGQYRRDDLGVGPGPGSGPPAIATDATVVTVTGVQVIRGGGEAGTVIVRGLGGVVTLLNGREIFSDAGRSLYLADIPATMLQRIDVTKTPGGDLPEGGTAGVIDVRTSRPFLLWADADADVLDPASWTKSPEPVPRTCYEHGIYGPGHNSFTFAEDGDTVMLVYHARTYAKIVGDPLWNPDRHTFVKPLRRDEQGMPLFGRAFTH
jgi:hypothetical protein